MATIRRAFTVPTPADDVWEVFRDVGAVHTRLAPGFVMDTVLAADDRREVTFANGVTVTERIVALDDDLRRLAYTVMDGTAEHHHASFEVLDDGDGARVVWTTDVLPDSAAGVFAPMVDAGTAAMQGALSTGARGHAAR